MKTRLLRRSTRPACIAMKTPLTISTVLRTQDPAWRAPHAMTFIEANPEIFCLREKTGRRRVEHATRISSPASTRPATISSTKHLFPAHHAMIRTNRSISEAFPHRKTRSASLAMRKSRGRFFTSTAALLSKGAMHATNRTARRISICSGFQRRRTFATTAIPPSLGFTPIFREIRTVPVAIRLSMALIFHHSFWSNPP